MPSNILLYADAGSAWLTALLHALVGEIEPGQPIRLIGAAHILQEAHLFDDAAALIIPGGAATPYCQKLNGAGNARIRDFVENGGAYLGICAGGYYGCDHIHFHRGRPDQIIQRGELAFFKGIGVGSIPEFGRYYDMTKASAATPELLLENGQSVAAYYNGGGFFEPAPGFGCRAIARYADLPGQPPAIVEIDAGKGRAILTGVHPEVSADALEADLRSHGDGQSYAPLVEKLRATERARRALWRSILDRCGLSVVKLVSD